MKGLMQDHPLLISSIYVEFTSSFLSEKVDPKVNPILEMFSSNNSVKYLYEYLLVIEFVSLIIGKSTSYLEK